MAAVTGAPEPDTLDEVAHAFASMMAQLVPAIPGAWARSQAGAYAAVSGAPMSMMNGVLVADPTSDPAAVTALLREVAATALPHCIQLRPHASHELLAVPEAAGMQPYAAMPLMTLSQPAGFPRAPAASEISLRELEPGEAFVHVAIAAEGFGMPEEILATFVSEAVLSLPDVRAYVGEVDGAAVATAIGLRHDRLVGIFNVATLPAHRRRGYGAAITAFAVRDAFEDGADAAALQTSDMGRGVYESLGFELAEHWSCWVSVEPATEGAATA
jgi:ribosomal protein S18 acetylase RimI-like enzyme